MSTVQGVRAGATDSWALGPRDVTYWAAAVFLVALVMDGVIRYGVGGSALYPLVYLPKVCLALAMLATVLMRRRVKRSALAVFALGVVAAIWSAVQLRSVSQTLFGFWVTLPFLFGLAAAPLLLSEPRRYGRLAAFLVVLAGMGMLANPFIKYPWVGATTTVYGHSIPAARALTTYWLERYPGFSHSSINAASQLLVLAVVATWSGRRRATKLFLWALSGAGIYLSTSKGVQGAYLLLSIYFATMYFGGRHRLVRMAWGGVAWILTATAIGVPLSTLWIRYSLSFRSVWTGFLYGSYGVRLDSTWPTAFASLRDMVAWFLGNGVGAVGSAQRYFGGHTSLLADNLFVYLAVSVGAPLAFIILLGTFWRVTRRYVLAEATAMLVFPLLLASLAYGEVSDIVEGTAVYALVFGVIVSYAFCRRKRIVQADA